MNSLVRKLNKIAPMQSYCPAGAIQRSLLLCNGLHGIDLTTMEPRSLSPSSLFQCFGRDEGSVDIMKYMAFKRSTQQELLEEDYMVIIAACEAQAAAESQLQSELNDPNTTEAPRKRQRREKRVVRERTTGDMREMTYTDTAWYKNYVQSPNRSNKKFNNKFRRRFRMKYSSFEKHLQEVKSHPLFRTWSTRSSDCVGNKAVPIELLLLGALRYIGRGWCLDDLEEQTCISEETHRRFIHIYITWGASAFHDKYVRFPENAEEAKAWSVEYSRAGFPGCVSSGDATHVGMLKCLYKLRQYNMSHKLQMPSRTYNIHVTHRRRILHEGAS